MDKITQGAWNLLGAMNFGRAVRTDLDEVSLQVTLDTPSGAAVGHYVMSLDEAREMYDSLGDALA